MTGVTLDSRPRLRRGVRIDFDHVRGADVLLYPEGVVFPNRTAIDVLRRCDGETTIAAITAQLRRRYDTVEPAEIADLVSRLRERGLVEV